MTVNRLPVYLLAVCLAAPLAAQQPLAASPRGEPQVSNAQLETRSAADGLEQAFRGIIAAQSAPAWVGYAVPLVEGRQQMCCSSGQDCWSACALEGTKSGWNHSSDAEGVKLEGPRQLLVLFRVEQGAVQKIRNFSEDCQLDAGGLRFIWLTDVRAADSITLLKKLAQGGDESERAKRKLSDGAVAAIALHSDSAADRAIEELAGSTQPRKLREKAVFWLGAARGRRGYEILSRLVREDSDDKIREKAVFALYVSKQPEATDAIIRTARQDRSARVRGQALFWLAQKAGQKAAAAITDAVANDPDTTVKKRAVFALSQLPGDEGVPLLIQVARTNRNPAVRKQAIFWLGQSKDPRALEFFEEILKP